MRLIIVSHDLSQNALGRAHVIWTLARAAGYQTLIRGMSRGPVWEPLRSSEIAADILISNSRRELVDEPQSLAVGESVLVPIKTWPTSLGICLDVARRTGLPLIADIDDPDHAALAGPAAPAWYRTAFRFRMRLRRESPHRFDQLQSEVQSVTRMVSNPILRETYGGGYIVPHARNCSVRPTEFGRRSKLRVAFVGTPRRHKGLDLLRSVVAELRDEGVELIVTSNPPKDARPWERWVGLTDMRDGQRLVSECDVVVVPQLDRSYATAQLPARIIDAMSAGRPIVATDTRPIRWALADAGLLVPPGDMAALTSSLSQLFDVELRRRLGLRAWQRATDVFSVEAILPTFVEAVSSATLS